MILVVFLRLSSARLLVPVGTMAAGLALLLDSGWQGSWGDTVIRVSTHLVLVLPCVMAAAALDARRLLRARTAPTVVAAVHPMNAIVLAVAGAAGWGIGGYGVLLATGFAATSRMNPLFPPPLPVWWMGATIAAVVAHAAVGVLLGRLVPALVAVGVAALLGLVGNAALAAYQGKVPALVTVADDAFLGGPTVARTLVQLAQVAFLLAAAVAAVATTAVLVRRSRRVVCFAVVGVIAAVAAGAGLAATGGPKRETALASPGPQACAPDGIVCLWPDRAFLVETYAEPARLMLAGAPESLPYRGWTENGLARPASRAELEITAVQPAADTVALDLAGGLVDAGRPGDSEAERWAAQVWLAARAHPRTGPIGVRTGVRAVRCRGA